MSDLNRKRKAPSDDDVDPQQVNKIRKLSPQCGTSGRQALRQRIENVGATNRSKGQVRNDSDGSMWWIDPRTSAPVAAVYHNDIRDILLDRADSNGSLHYTYERAKGLASNDRTAFHAAQQHWSLDRDDWPIVRGLDVLHQFEKNGYQGTWAGVAPELMFEPDGRLVLDQDNHPIKVFPDLPLTLSSRIEDCLLELWMRLDPRIGRPDILARLPNQQKTYEKGRIPIFGLTAIGMKRSRFRQRHGLISWEPRANKPRVSAYMRERLARFDATAIARNSTRGTPPLSAAEYKEIDAMDNKAKSKKRENGTKKAELLSKKKITLGRAVQTSSQQSATEDSHHVANTRHLSPYYAADAPATPGLGANQPTRSYYQADAALRTSNPTTLELLASGIYPAAGIQNNAYLTPSASPPTVRLPWMTGTNRMSQHQPLAAYQSAVPKYMEDQEYDSDLDLAVEMLNQQANNALVHTNHMQVPVPNPAGPSVVSAPQTAFPSTNAVPVYLQSTPFSVGPPTIVGGHMETPSDPSIQTFIPPVPGVAEAYAVISDLNPSPDDHPPTSQPARLLAVDDADVINDGFDQGLVDNEAWFNDWAHMDPNLPLPESAAPYETLDSW